VHDQVGKLQALRREPGVVKACGEAIPGQVVPARNRAGQDLGAPGRNGCVDAGVAVGGGVGLLKPRRGERKKPPEIVPVDKMPGGPEDVGPQDPAVCHGLLDVRRGNGWCNSG
jgi:hypothetical protein